MVQGKHNFLILKFQLLMRHLVLGALWKLHSLCSLYIIIISLCKCCWNHTKGQFFVLFSEIKDIAAMVTRWQPLVPSTREEQKGKEMGEQEILGKHREKSDTPQILHLLSTGGTLLTLVGSSCFHQCKSKNRSIPWQIIHLPSSTQGPVEMSGRHPVHLQVESRAAHGGWTARLPLLGLRESPNLLQWGHVSKWFRAVYSMIFLQKFE